MEVTVTALQLERRPALQAVIIDLTERRRAEGELQNALAKEREMSQLRSEFVSLVSHEFRTPLEIIMSSVDNLLRYHDRLPPEKREQLLHTVNKAARRMSEMMEEVLVLGRHDTGRMTFHPTPIDLPSLSRRICDEIDSATGNRGCGIPAVDQKRLFQAFHRGSNAGQVPGTGLGLLIVQRCVALHSGEIGFDSVQGRGTTFTVRLPLFTQPSPNP